MYSASIAATNGIGDSNDDNLMSTANEPSQDGMIIGISLVSLAAVAIAIITVLFTVCGVYRCRTMKKSKNTAGWCTDSSNLYFLLIIIQHTAQK